jgi:lipid-A-disaccharide synthase
LCLLPFEKSFYDEHGLAAVFVGHPKADALPNVVDTAAARDRLGFSGGGQVIAVLPGSRASEVSRLGPVFAEAAARIRRHVGGCHFVTPIARPKLRSMFERALRDADVTDSFTLLDGESELAMTSADVVLLASGTAALEAALLQKPTVVAYKVAALTAFIVRSLGMLKVNQFSLPNLLTETPQVPEIIQENATPDALASAVIDLLQDPERRAAISRRFAKLRADLAQGANLRAADAVLRLAKRATTTTHSS